jgi:hypothetical protein
MKSKISDLAIGPGIPLALSALWYGVLRQFLSKPTADHLYTEPPMKFLVPLVLFAVSLSIAVVCWKRRRLASYGVISLLVIQAILATAIFVQRIPR